MTRATGIWGGRDVDRARKLMETTLPVKCVTCPTIVQRGSDWVIHHEPSRGELIASGQAHRQFDRDTWHVQCRPCSNKSGQQGVIAKAKAEARAEAGASARDSGSHRRRSGAFLGGRTPADRKSVV